MCDRGGQFSSGGAADAYAQQRVHGQVNMNVSRHGPDITDRHPGCTRLH